MQWHVQGDEVYSGPWLVARLSVDVPATVRDAVEQEIAAWDGKSAYDPGLEECMKDAQEEADSWATHLAKAEEEIDRLIVELAALKNPPLPADEDDAE